MRSRNKTLIYVIFVLLFLLIGVGYAVLNANLTVTGTNTIAAVTWDIHFEKPLPTTKSTITPTTAPVALEGGTTKDLTYAVTFDTPGQVYEFTVDVVNSGTIDAMIESVSSTIKKGDAVAEALTSNNLPGYLNYYVTYSDGLELAAKQRLDHGTYETVKVHVEFKRDITNEQLQEASGKTFIFTFGINYIQADGTEENITGSKLLGTDTWEQVVASAQLGTYRQYVVGSTKDVTLSIDLDNDGTPEDHTYTLRVANTRTPSACAGTNYSQTACGFVLEFADVITQRPMNLEYDNGAIGTGNIGGWEYSLMRTYVNNTVYNAMPSPLKGAIRQIKVISGHGNTSGETNYITDDYLYLLSSVEVWGSVYDDTLDETMTRQLDYYHNQHVTLTKNLSYASKKRENGSDSRWWLRTPISIYYITFDNVYEDGSTNCNSAHHEHGVSPAFRLA